MNVGSVLLGIVIGFGAVGLVHILMWLNDRRRERNRLRTDYRWRCADCDAPTSERPLRDLPR